MPDAYNPWGAPVFPTADDNAMQPETYANPVANHFFNGAIDRVRELMGMSWQPSDHSQEQTRFTTASPLVNISNEDIDRGINVAMSAGPGSIKGYHGSPLTDLRTISANPPTRQFDNATSQLGAYFAPKPAGAERYAGNTGKVYSAEVPIENAYEMPWGEFNALQSPHKGPNGESLPGDMWGARADQLKQDAAALRGKLQDAGHDGVIVRKPNGEIYEMSSFGDVPVPPSIKAYHGSPHDFDKFDLSKIGTGEGAQAYGHGLYFADSEGVAKSYRDALSKQVNVSGSQLGSHPMDSPLATAQHSIVGDVANGIDPAEAIATQAAQWRQAAEPYRKFALENPEHADVALQQANSFEEVARSVEKQNPADYVKNPGHMYEVNINADPSHFLDWDKPLSQQSPQVQAAFAHEAPTEIGSEAFHKLQNALIENKIMPNAASDVPLQHLQAQHLREAGIPGIKYLDQGSRGAGEGSSNYVVFNHDLIDIMRKYAVPGMLGAPILANALSEQKT